MKKLISLILVLITLLSLTACGAPDAEAEGQQRAEKDENRAGILAFHGKRLQVKRYYFRYSYMM